MTPDRARPTASSRCPITRSRWLTAGPVTRNDTGAWSMRGEDSSPASPSSVACTDASRSSPRESAASYGSRGARTSATSAAVTVRACAAASRASSASRTARAVATGTPCRNATPSFVPNRYGATPAPARASVAGTRAPPASRASPVPVRNPPRCASGMISPAAPLPVAGTAGCRSVASTVTSCCARAADAPVSGSSSVRNRVASTARAVRRSSQGALPTAAGEHQVALVVRLVGRADGEVGLRAPSRSSRRRPGPRRPAPRG